MMARELDEKPWIAQALLDLAKVAHAQGEDEKAWTLLEEAQALGGEVGDTNLQSNIWLGQGHVLLDLGDYAAARSRFEEGLALRRQGENLCLIAWALLEVGHAAWLQGEQAVTQSHALEAVALLREGNDKEGLPHRQVNSWLAEEGRQVWHGRTRR